MRVTFTLYKQLSLFSHCVIHNIQSTLYIKHIKALPCIIELRSYVKTEGLRWSHRHAYNDIPVSYRAVRETRSLQLKAQEIVAK